MFSSNSRNDESKRYRKKQIVKYKLSSVKILPISKWFKTNYFQWILRFVWTSILSTQVRLLVHICYKIYSVLHWLCITVVTPAPCVKGHFFKFHTTQAYILIPWQRHVIMLYSIFDEQQIPLRKHTYTNFSPILRAVDGEREGDETIVNPWNIT